MPQRSLTAVSLFSGAGGLDIGLEQAGFEVVSMVEADADCVLTLKANQGRRIGTAGGTWSAYEHARILHRNIEEITIGDLVRTNENIMLLVGGPPCQPFSFCGKMRSLEDPRGNLFEHFVRLTKELLPPLILLENVQGLVTAKGPQGVPGEVLAMVRSRFEELGYGTRVALLNAADYGVPQRRVRFFMIASRHEPLPSFPEPNHAKDASDGLLFGLKRWVNLGETLSDLPPPDVADTVRPKPRMEEKLLGLKPGTGLKTAGIREANRPSGHWGYRQDSFLADPNLPSRTIRSAATPDWIFDRDGKLRRLTWRECAVLQSFPSDWEFIGGRTSKFKQIGNAVPPLLSHGIALSLRESLEAMDRRSSPPDSADLPSNFLRAIKYTISENRVNGESRKERERIYLRDCESA